MKRSNADGLSTSTNRGARSLAHSFCESFGGYLDANRHQTSGALGECRKSLAPTSRFLGYIWLIAARALAAQKEGGSSQSKKRPPVRRGGRKTATGRLSISKG